MKIEMKFAGRLKSLIEAYSEVSATRQQGSRYVTDFHKATYDFVSGEIAFQWGTSCLHVISLTFGKDSDHYKQFDLLFKGFPQQVSVSKALGVLKAAEDDYKSGFTNSLITEISGEIFQNFIALAKQALIEGSKDVAAVLACAALEDALKRYARKNGLDVDGKDMNQIVAGLKAKGLVGGVQKTLLDTMPKIRNCAMHADWGKIQEPDVNSVIGFVEQFLITHF